MPDLDTYFTLWGLAALLGYPFVAWAFDDNDVED